jgi:hypothetical protein
MKELLDNVSLFWSKYFKDSQVLYSLLEGAIRRVSEYKQDISSTLISNGLDSTPTSLKRSTILLELEDSNFKSIQVMGWPENDEYLVYNLGSTNIRSLPFLSVTPEGLKVLENGVDYIFDRGDSELFQDITIMDPFALEEDSYYIWFSKDPRLNSSFRVEKELSVGNYILTIEEHDWAELEFEAWDVLAINDSLGIEIGKARVARFFPDTNQLYLHVSTPVLDPSLVKSITNLDSWTTFSVSEVSEFLYDDNKLQCWAMNATVDPNTLASKYVHLHKSIFNESSEKYRSFLTGLLLLKTRSFSIQNLKAAISLCSGVPVFYTSFEDGDRIIRVDKAVTNDYHRVHTTEATYEIPKQLTIRQEILDDAIEISEDGVRVTIRPEDFTQNFNFKNFDLIVSGIDVLEGSQSEDSWWNRGLPNSRFIVLPESIMLGQTPLRRTIINYPYPNQVGEVTVEVDSQDFVLPPAAVGDYGIYVGDNTRNTVAYNLFKDFLRNHFILVSLSKEFSESSSISNLSILEDINKAISDSSLPSSVVLVTADLDAPLFDSDGDGIPDIIDPQPYEGQYNDDYSI